MSETFLGIYENLNGGEVSVKDLVAGLFSDLAQDVPPSLQVKLANAAFAYASGTASNALFSVSIDGGVNLADLPVVGIAFSQSTMLRFDIQVAAAKNAWTADQLGQLNKLIPATAPQLPAPSGGIATGLSGLCTLSIGNVSIPLALPFNPSAYPGGQSIPREEADAPNITWYPIQKTLGPLTVQKAGVGFDSSSGVVSLYLDGGIVLSSLQVNLEGLSVSTPIQALSPSFSLAGLGFAFASPGLQLSAAFLNAGGGVYAGSANLETEAISIGAIGAYAPDAEDHPSLVVYAYVGGFAAGPPCLTVEGLAAGFGYNRSLVAPTLEQVSTYPLVAAVLGTSDPMASAATAMQSPQQGSGLAASLSALSTYFPPSEGEDFAAFGVKVSSFQMVDAFLLLEAAFGHDFSLNLVGLATATLPPPKGGEAVSPLAKVQIALLASWQPSLGSFLLEAQLTSASYLLSPSCHLTGGLALAVWYGDNTHAGDFVFTLGGYNKAFDPPDYYPRPQPLGLSWQVSPQLSVQGHVYFALCPHLLMAGGSMQAVWTDGGLRADFTMGFDVVVGWKPFFYTADLNASLDISYHGKILGISTSLSLEIGASLDIWGPDFSGTAKIDVHGIGFTLDFGGASRGGPPPLNWAQFQSSFLPAGGAYWSHTVAQGATPVTKTLAPGDLGIVNASQLLFQIGSAIPLTELDSPSSAAGAPIGIAPMNQGVGSVTTVASVSIVNVETSVDVTDHFLVEPVIARLPAALWGGAVSPAINQDSLIEGGITGCMVAPAAPPSPGKTAIVAVTALQSDPIDQDSAFEWTTVTISPVVTENDSARRAAIASTVIVNQPAQAQLLASLGLAMDVDCAASVADIFLIAPQIIAES
jgi:hypothetical protein